MSFSLIKDEQAAWDGFANTALRAVLSGQPIRGDVAADIAARLADSMIEERRKRQKPSTAQSTPLRV